MQDRTDYAALIGSRICHDLISPIGAIGNGVELMMMEGGKASPELALVAESVASANARIRFFRLAFGMAGGDQRIARSEVTGILAALTQGGRFKAEWSSPGEIDRRDVKLAFLLLQCAESALPYGGRVRISETGTGWKLAAGAARLRIESRHWDMFAPDFVGLPAHDAGDQPLPASHVQYALALETLRARGLDLRYSFTAETISLEW